MPALLLGTCVRPRTGSWACVLGQERVGEVLSLSPAEEGAAGGHPRQNKTGKVPEHYHLFFLRNLHRVNLVQPGLAEPQTHLPGRESASAH